MLRENKYDSLITSLCQTVHDYRKNEQFCFTPSHVRRWVNQFDPSDQQTILEEMNVIMAKFYFSEATIKALIRKFIKDHLVGKNNPEYILPRIEFLRIQQKGLSQAALLNIVEDIISEEYQLSIHAMKRHEKYTYSQDETPSVSTSIAHTQPLETLAQNTIDVLSNPIPTNISQLQFQF